MSDKEEKIRKMESAVAVEGIGRQVSSDQMSDMEEEKKSETVEETLLASCNNHEKEWIDDFQPLSIDDYLDSDPVDNHGDASFTGVWTAAKGLLKYLQENVIDSTCVLELGAGTGSLGITICRNSTSNLQHMILTDSARTGAVSWTESNLDAARKQGLPNMDRVEVVPMDWKNQDQVDTVAAMYQFDLMLGSDLIYSEDRIQPLARTISTLLEKQSNNMNSPRFLYGHTQGRMKDMDQLWEQELKAHGLSWRVVASMPQWDDRKTLIMDIFRHKEC